MKVAPIDCAGTYQSVICERPSMQVDMDKPKADRHAVGSGMAFSMISRRTGGLTGMVIWREAQPVDGEREVGLGRLLCAVYEPPHLWSFLVFPRTT